jgi:hypothetical protein
MRVLTLSRGKQTTVEMALEVLAAISVLYSWTNVLGRFPSGEAGGRGGGMAILDCCWLEPLDETEGGVVEGLS